ncbi:ABC transporter permease [Pyrococcus furiosus DSM 3638]|uniref:ABC transporter permease n=2 Tax=Pyrococcus furiosus TaxID=2261 RepID=Q8U119_PYRFU|nr:MULTISPECIES: ABC transporter permease [Pyrococcus]AAL81534.1 dipeptide transport system permease protein [Pyrococcus furiosus DSM 3638]AFN04191.1 binding-protein-dependent transport systems inner membrane component [Pyrococcus furiosus COM1]MDK2868866.1 peptide/nickel transport system permease protein [Pyrococcus sp.]QEK79042.1 ABC transporter permease [Pyrococcus furiosus DSM 3638]
MQEEYKKSILDKLADKFVYGLGKFISLFKKGWMEKNRSKLEEWRLMLYALNRSPPALIGLFLVMIFIFLGIFGPYLAPWKYNFMPTLYTSNYDQVYLVPPGSKAVLEYYNNAVITYPLGSDHYGRDLLSLILQGARTSFVISIIVIILGVPLGIILGLIAGYYGGKIDELIMRITDMFLSFPALILAIALSAVLPERLQEFISAHPILEKIVLAIFALDQREAGNLGRLLAVIVAMIIVWWPGYARITRGSTLAEREKLYIEAARAIGLPTRTILFKHILPNIIGPILVYITLDFGSVVLMEAGLSFLGLGATPPIADWGRIVYDGAQYFPRCWWLVFYPGLVVLLTALGWNLLGDGLRDILDPKTRRSIEFKVKKKEGEKSA